MPTKPLILFDIDKTLIDTDRLRILQRETLANALDTSSEAITDAFQKYYGTLQESTRFNPTNFIEFLSQQFHFPVKKLRGIFLHPKNFQLVLYPEVVGVLTTLRTQHYPLGLYSQGNRENQEHKLLANNLMTFFEPQYSYILQQKMDTAILENLPEHTIIIDDRPEVIEFVGKFPQLLALHMVRDGAPPVGEYTLSNLTELFPILESLYQSERE